MTARRSLALFAALAFSAVLAYAGFTLYTRTQTEQCYACRRAIHAHSRTIALDNGKRRTFCCPACALTEHAQEGKPVQIVELTAFLTGARLSPSGAFIVKGSNVNTCAHARELLDADKHPAELQYDRCSPSMLAFANRTSAVEFARTHGGEVLPFSQISSAYAH